MTDIIFCRPAHNYESYADFWRLVELSGFPIISVSDLDISQDGIYITAPMNRDWRNHINAQHKQRKPVNAHLILWNIERPSGSAGSVMEYARQQRYLFYGLWENGQRANELGEESFGRFIDEVWVSDQRLANETHLRFVVLGSDEGLGEPGDGKRYDLIHLSYQTGRRVGIYSKFRADQIGPNSWPPERDEILKASRFALSVHQDIHPFQEPLRFALFAAYGLPIISESIYDMTPWFENGTDGTIITATYDNLVSRLNTALSEDYGKYKEMGLRARDRMTREFRFKDMVERAVSESVRNWR